jgi:hypothetical protein
MTARRYRSRGSAEPTRARSGVEAGKGRRRRSPLAAAASHERRCCYPQEAAGPSWNKERAVEEGKDGGPLAMRRHAGLGLAPVGLGGALVQTARRALLLAPLFCFCGPSRRRRSARGVDTYPGACC